MFLNLQHFEGGGGKQGMLELRDGDQNNDKGVNYSHKFAQTKQQIGQCVVGALLVHK